MAWLFRYITVWRRFVQVLGWTLAIVLLIEVAIIDLQAARGTPSHFNLSTDLNAALFMVIGTSILVLWLASVGVLVALFRQKFADPAWGWWLRLGMLVTVLGSAAGGMMLRMTPEQVEEERVERPSAVGAHTVGAPEWWTRNPRPGLEHGARRFAHRALLRIARRPDYSLLGWLVRRRLVQSDRSGVSLAFATAASYLGFIAILAWQRLEQDLSINGAGARFVEFCSDIIGAGLSIPDPDKRDSK